MNLTLRSIIFSSHIFLLLTLFLTTYFCIWLLNSYHLNVCRISVLILCFFYSFLIKYHNKKILDLELRIRQLPAYVIGNSYKLKKQYIIHIHLNLILYLRNSSVYNFYPSVHQNALFSPDFLHFLSVRYIHGSKSKRSSEKAIGEGGQLPNFFTNFQFLFNRKTCRNWTEIARSISVFSEIKSRSCPTSRNSWK